MRFPLLLAFLFLFAGARAQSAWYTALLQDRQTHDEAFRNDPESPLPADTRATFTGLRYFEPDNHFLTSAEVIRLKKPKKVWFATSDGGEKEYVHFADLRFLLLGKTYTLAAYYSPAIRQREGLSKHIFVPFKDLTNLVETYGGGRYLDLTEPGDDRLEIDFNRAYNPYCAYSDGYACPKVPEQNYLNLRIEAGEKNFYTEK